MGWSAVRHVAHIVVGWFIFHGSLDAKGQEAQDGPNPQQDGEAPEQLTAELDPLRSCGGWSEGVGSIPSQDVLSPLVGKALGSKAGRHEIKDAGPTCLPLHPQGTSAGSNVQMDLAPLCQKTRMPAETPQRRWHL